MFCLNFTVKVRWGKLHFIRLTENVNKTDHFNNYRYTFRKQLYFMVINNYVCMNI